MQRFRWRLQKCKVEKKNRRLRRAFDPLLFFIEFEFGAGQRAAPRPQQPLTPIRICGGYGIMMPRPRRPSEAAWGAPGPPAEPRRASPLRGEERIIP